MLSNVPKRMQLNSSSDLTLHNIEFYDMQVELNFEMVVYVLGGT